MGRRTESRRHEPADPGARPTMRRLPRRIGWLVAVTLVAGLAVPTVAQVAFDCVDVHVIWGRGSGLALDSTIDFQPYREALEQRIDTDQVDLSFYQLGQDGGYDGFAYEAAGDLLDLASAFFPFGSYTDSVATGIAEFSAYLGDRADACPDETYVVGGFSQGAQVVGAGLYDVDASVRERIAAVTLFGDPTRKTNNTFAIGPIRVGEFPRECLGITPAWNRGSAPCWTIEGILGAREDYLPDDIAERSGSWCRFLDGVCTGVVAQLATAFFDPIRAHFAYFDDNSDVADAAQEVAVRLAERLPDLETAFDVTIIPIAVGVTGADLVFVIDTTGSMADDIAEATAQAGDLAATWLALLPNARVGLVQYRDHGDVFVSQTELALTNDIGAFEAAVAGLNASGGGDYPEAMLSGISTALEEMPWRPGATKAAVVIGDAPGKDPEPNTGLTRAAIAQRALEIDPVNLYNVITGGGSEVEAFFQPLAETTDGEIIRASGDTTLTEALFETLTSISDKPVAVANGPYIAPIGEQIRFSAEGSYAVEGEITDYAWDFDADGSVDVSGDQPVATFTYPGAYDGLAIVEVTTSTGDTAIASAEVTVDDVGLGDRLPLAPLTTEASSDGTETTTISWTTPEDDRATGYLVLDGDGNLLAVAAEGATQATVETSRLGNGAYVVASNEFGRSGAVEVDVATFDFDGFHPPVDEPPVVNAARAGRAIPLKFSLGGDLGLDVLAEGSPTSVEVACDDGAVVDELEETTTAGGSSLSYDASADQYVYVWATSPDWSGTCRELRLVLADGSVHLARFQFR